MAGEIRKEEEMFEEGLNFSYLFIFFLRRIQVITKQKKYRIKFKKNYELRTPINIKRFM